MSLCLGFLWIPGYAQAALPAKSVHEGLKLYNQGDFATSAKKFQEALEEAPESDILNFDTGTALYKSNDFLKAIEHLQKALLSDRRELKGKAHYNLGNALYRFGILKEKINIDEAIASLEKSLDHYQQAITMDPEDEDTRFNYDFVTKELARLKKKRETIAQSQQGKEDQGRQNPKEDATPPIDKESTPQDQETSPSDDTEKTGSEEVREQPSPKPVPDQEGQAESDRDSVQGEPEGTEASATQAGSPDSEDQVRQNDSSPLGQVLTQEEAEMLLKDYLQNEEPQGLLNFYKNRGYDEPVLKDW